MHPSMSDESLFPNDDIEFNLFDDEIDEIDDIDNAVDNFMTHYTSIEGNSWEILDRSLDVSTESLPRLHVEGEHRRSPPPMEAEDPLLGRVVTPDYKPKVQAPPLEFNAVELQLEYLRTLKKLAKSMRRSDETRSIVKRQRSSDNDENFFMTRRWSELEQDRNKISKIIHHDSTHRTVF